MGPAGRTGTEGRSAWGARRQAGRGGRRDRPGYCVTTRRAVKRCVPVGSCGDVGVSGRAGGGWRGRVGPVRSAGGAAPRPKRHRQKRPGHAGLQAKSSYSVGDGDGGAGVGDGDGGAGGGAASSASSRETDTSDEEAPPSAARPSYDPLTTLLRPSRAILAPLLRPARALRRSVRGTRTRCGGGCKATPPAARANTSASPRVSEGAPALPPPPLPVLTGHVSSFCPY